MSLIYTKRRTTFPCTTYTFKRFVDFCCVLNFSITWVFVTLPLFLPFSLKKNTFANHKRRFSSVIRSLENYDWGLKLQSLHFYSFTLLNDSKCRDCAWNDETAKNQISYPRICEKYGKRTYDFPHMYFDHITILKYFQSLSLNSKSELLSALQFLWKSRILTWKVKNAKTALIEALF